MRFAPLLAATVLVCYASADQRHLLKTTNPVDFEESWSEKTKVRQSSAAEHDKRHTLTEIDEARRPVIGVLTEPLRGDLYKSKQVDHEDDTLITTSSEQSLSYVPKAHVQFLEQAGVRVVPVDYRLPVEDRFALFDQLNGVYLPGDS